MGKLLKEVRRNRRRTTGNGLLEDHSRGDPPRLAKDHEVGGVCLAVPGYILARENKVLSAANLEAIEGVPLERGWADRTGLTGHGGERREHAAAWREFRFGAGKDVDHLLLVTLGTGVGGGVVSHGVLLRMSMVWAGSWGTSPSRPPVPAAAAAITVCLEALASGTAIRRRAREVAGQETGLGSWVARPRSEHSLGEDVLDLARKGDEASLRVLREAGTWLGIGLAAFVNVFDPEVIAVGGASGRRVIRSWSPHSREVRLR